MEDGNDKYDATGNTPHEDGQPLNAAPDLHSNHTKGGLCRLGVLSSTRGTARPRTGCRRTSLRETGLVCKWNGFSLPSPGCRRVAALTKDKHKEETACNENEGV